MTTTDLPHLAALRTRAERGTPRGAAAVLAGARDDLPAALPTRAPRSRRGLAIAAAALAVAGLGAGIATTIGGRDDPRAAGDDAWCAALAAPVAVAPGTDGDVVAYLRPEATEADLAALEAELRSDDRVASTATVGRDATYARFRLLFADQSAMLDAVRPEDLPPSISIELRDPDRAEEVITELDRRSDLFGAVAGRPDVRALDLLVWPGTGSDVWASPGNVDLGTSPYPASWPAHAAAVVDATPPELAAPVGTLVDRIAQVPVELLPVDERADAPGPTFEAAQAAAQTVRDAAADRCDLEVTGQYAEAGIRRETTVTVAAGGN
ncbi:MAG TPA: permease-like cell division protein FtsX [Aquihabitans sp.]|nr:permease-like cell division protein FtsX [Aquihabitans sp.]